MTNFTSGFIVRTCLAKPLLEVRVFQPSFEKLLLLAFFNRLNRVKLGRTVTFMKYLASVVSLVFLPETLTWNKITFWLSNSLKHAQLEVNQLTERISKKI